MWIINEVPQTVVSSVSSDKMGSWINREHNAILSSVHAPAGADPWSCWKMDDDVAPKGGVAHRG